MTSMTNVASAGSGAICDQTVHSNTQLWLKGKQAVGSGAVVDYSGNGNDATLAAGLSDAACWANPGYFSTIDAVNGHVVVPLNQVNVDLNAGESIIIGFNIIRATNATNKFLCGNTSSSSTGGFRIQHEGTTNILKFVSSDGTNNNFWAFSGSTAECDGTLHHVVIAIDGNTHIGYKFLDGVLNGTDTPAIAVAGATTNSSITFRIGTSSTDAEAAQWNDFRVIVIPSGGLPLEIQSIVNKMQAFWECPITPDDF